MDSKQRWNERNPNYQKEYYEKNKEKINLQKKLCRDRNKDQYAEVARKRYHTKRELIIQQGKSRRMLNPKTHLLSLARARAKKNKLAIDITQDDFEIPEVCPLLGIPIYVTGVKATDNSPSLDKIIPSLGYVKGNVWVISFRANRLKSDSTADELLLLASNLKIKENE